MNRLFIKIQPKKIIGQGVVILLFIFCLDISSAFANDYLQGVNTNIEETKKKYEAEVKELQKQITAKMNNPNSNYDFYLKEAENIKQESNKHIFTQNIDVDEVLQGYYNTELKNSQQGSAGEAEKTINHLLIFISFSMPKQSLKERIEEAKRTGATLVLRGIIKDSITETAKELNKLTNNTGVNAIIDPNLFKAFSITKVPVIVVAKYRAYPCEDKCNYTPIHDKISGNISLEYALEQIISSRETITKPLAKKYLKKLRGKNNV
ncbi:type-F conjugative transfer system pilin assembly protein TrbC [Pseudomonadota bacterium]